MAKLELPTLILVFVCHAVFSEDDFSCYENFRQCRSLDPRIFSPSVPGLVFPVYTQNTIDGGCRLLEELVFCHYNTTNISGCDTYNMYYDLHFPYISIAETVVQKVCKGQGRQDIESFLTCANNMEVQVQFLMTFHRMEGYLKASKTCGLDEKILENVCSELTWRIYDLVDTVRYRCSDEDFARFQRLLQLFNDSQQEIFNVIAPSIQQTNCTFLINVHMD